MGYALCRRPPIQFWDIGEHKKQQNNTLRSRPWFLLIFGGFWYPWVSFGMLGASPLASWGTLGRSWGDPGAVLGRSWDDPGTLEGTRKDPVRSGLDFVDFLMILGTHSESFLGIFGPKKKIFSYLFPGCFFCWFLGLNFGVWDWENMHLAWKVLQKSTFAEIGFLMIPGPIFHDFWWLWDQFSWFLMPWGLAWNLMSFQGDSGVTPDPAPRLVEGNRVLPGR